MYPGKPDSEEAGSEKTDTEERQSKTPKTETPMPEVPRSKKAESPGSESEVDTAQSVLTSTQVWVSYIRMGDSHTEMMKDSSTTP